MGRTKGAFFVDLVRSFKLNLIIVVVLLITWECQAFSEPKENRPASTGDLLRGLSSMSYSSPIIRLVKEDVGLLPIPLKNIPIELICKKEKIEEYITDNRGCFTLVLPLNFYDLYRTNQCEIRLKGIQNDKIVKLDEILKRRTSGELEIEFRVPDYKKK